MDGSKKLVDRYTELLQDDRQFMKHPNFKTKRRTCGGCLLQFFFVFSQWDLSSHLGSLRTLSRSAQGKIAPAPSAGAGFARSESAAA